MPDDQLYGLTLAQNRSLERLVIDARGHERPAVDVASAKSPAGRPPVRVIALTDRTYNSTESELLPYFRYDRKRTVFTVEQVGSALAGYVALTINGTRFVLECRRTSLSDVRVAGLLRATVFPGLWEFDFGDRDVDLVQITVENITAEENTTLCELLDADTAIYNGATIVRQEYWVSVPATTGSPAVIHQSVTDCIPYQTSTVPTGAIGAAIWSWDAGYLAMAWQCRTFSHATGYVEADDPVGLDGVDEEDEGGGGGGPGHDEEPVDL